MYIPGKDENAKLVKHVLMRRCLLMLVLLLRTISIAVENRFKTMQDLVNIGIEISRNFQKFFPTASFRLS